MTTEDRRATDPATHDVPTYGPAFWIGLALALPVVGYGLRGVVQTFSSEPLANWARWFVGGALVHDLVVAPAVGVVGWLVARRLPAIAVAPVQGALIASALVGLVAWPFARRYGATPGEPSFLAHDYTGAVLGTWAVLWTVAAVIVAIRAVSARRR